MSEFTRGTFFVERIKSAILAKNDHFYFLSGLLFQTLPTENIKFKLNYNDRCKKSLEKLLTKANSCYSFSGEVMHETHIVQGVPKLAEHSFLE